MSNKQQKEFVVNALTEMIKQEDNEDIAMLETMCGAKYTLRQIITEVRKESKIGKLVTNFILKPKIQEMLAEKNLTPNCV